MPPDRRSKKTPAYPKERTSASPLCFRVNGKIPNNSFPGRHCFFALVLRLRPTLIRAARVLPSMPPLSHNIERHFFDGQLGGFRLSAIHLWPQTSQTAIRIVFHPMQPLYSILP
jgi:hypothetical protein